MQHLTPDTAGLLDKPTDERIKALAKEKWVGHTQAQTILTYLAHMHHGPLVDPDAMNLLIIGESGSGKTSVMRHYASAYKPSGNGFPVLSIKLADGPKESALYETILDVLHFSYPPRASAKDKRSQLLRVLKTSNVANNPVSFIDIDGRDFIIVVGVNYNGPVLKTLGDLGNTTTAPPSKRMTVSFNTKTNEFDVKYNTSMSFTRAFVRRLVWGYHRGLSLGKKLLTRALPYSIAVLQGVRPVAQSRPERAHISLLRAGGS